MALHRYAIFRIQTVDTGAKGPADTPQATAYAATNETVEGLIPLLSRLHAWEGNPHSLSIRNAADDPSLNGLVTKHYADLNLFVREGDQWDVHGSDTGTLDGLADPLIDAIRSGRAHEVIICPPGAKGPFLVGS